MPFRWPGTHPGMDQAPGGFVLRADALDLRPGGTLTYTMTATGAQQVAFTEGAGLPLSTTSSETCTVVEPQRRLGYTTLADFVPGVTPYEFLTEAELTPTDDGVHVTMTVDAMHDQERTDRLVTGRRNELANLAALVGSRKSGRGRVGNPSRTPRRDRSVRCCTPPSPSTAPAPPTALQHVLRRERHRRDLMAISGAGSGRGSANDAHRQPWPRHSPAPSGI
ncbi:SRPBCC domain-containing protein [Kitasatospora sp. NPDC048722]|uniref:SRPBCC family protein n=1 Tax=Kitasatospora sp. NPDC048722 TaxID=3155639 RepID=UPI0033C93D06